MNRRKTARADVFRRRGTHLRIGFILALSTCLWAFSLKSVEHEAMLIEDIQLGDDEFALRTNIVLPEPAQPKAPKSEPVVDLRTAEIVETTVTKTEVKSSFTAIADFSDLINPDSVAKEVISTLQIEPYRRPAQMPEPQDGWDKFRKELAKAIVYPKDMATIGREGKVYIEFVVGKNGELRDFNVVRSTSPAFDRAALKAMQQLKPWKPGKHHGVPVDVYYNIPIAFELD